jgi:hypothetical protein
MSEPQPETGALLSSSCHGSKAQPRVAERTACATVGRSLARAILNKLQQYTVNTPFLRLTSGMTWRDKDGMIDSRMQAVARLKRQARQPSCSCHTT